VVEEPEVPGAAEHWAWIYRERACPLHSTGGSRERTEFRTVSFRFKVATRVRQAGVDWLAHRLVEALNACEPPPPKPEPESTELPFELAGQPPSAGCLAHPWRRLLRAR
jgi:hypothetical protein